MGRGVICPKQVELARLDAVAGIADTKAFVEFLKSRWDELQVLSAMFDSDGKIIKGDGNLSVRKHPTDDEHVWFYEVSGPGYKFVHMPTVASGLYADCGLPPNSKNPDARFFRYVNTPLAQLTKPAPKNTRVNFLVYGYRPTDLLHANLKA